MKALVKLQIQANSVLTEDEIIDIVGEQRFEELKNIYPGGILKSWVLAHEGQSNPVTWDASKEHSSQKSQKNIVWGREAIKSVYKKLRNGIKVYLGHNADNKNDGRDDYGQVVGRAQKIVSGKLSTIMIAHFPSETKEIAEQSDTVSMEGEWEMFKKGKEIIANAVTGITAIALGNTQGGDMPGFSGAREIATVQAFSETAVEEKPVEYEEFDFTGTKPDRGRVNKMRELVERYAFYPSQLFNPQDIIGKRKVMHDGSIEWIGGDRNLNKYINDTVVKDHSREMESKDKEIDSLKVAAKTLENDKARLDARPRIEALLKSKQVPERVLKLAMKRIGTLEIGDDIEKSFEDYIEKQILEDKELSEIGYGISLKTDTPDLGAMESNDSDENPFMDSKEPK